MFDGKQDNNLLDGAHRGRALVRSNQSLSGFLAEAEAS